MPFFLSAVIFLIVNPIANHDLPELCVAGHQPIARFVLAQFIRRNWSTHMFADKRFEPIP